MTASYSHEKIFTIFVFESTVKLELTNKEKTESAYSRIQLWFKKKKKLHLLEMKFSKFLFTCVLMILQIR